MVLRIQAELDIHLCTMYSLRIYANKVTWDPWMTQRRSIYSGVLWRLFPSESCHKDSEWQRAPAVFRDSENHSYICNFCSIPSLLTAKCGVLSTGWSILTESQEIQLTNLHCEGELLLQQWPQNHQQGSAIQSADASGANWGLVTEVWWLMQLGVSKANSMREDKKDMTSGWRQNMSPTSVIRGSQVTFLVQYLLKLHIHISYINEWSHFIPPKHWESALFHPSSSPIQTTVFNILPDDKGNLSLTPNPLQGARVSVQQNEGAMWYVSNSVIIFQEKNVSFVITVPVTHCPFLIHTISPTLFGPIRVSNPRCQVDTGQMMTRSSSRMLRTRKTKYSANMVTPKTRLILQRQAAMEAMTKRSIRKSNTMAQKRPLEVTVTGWPWWIRVYKSHGTGRLWTQRRDHLLWIQLDDSILVFHPLPQTNITKYKNWSREGAISRYHLTKTPHQIERKKDK